MMVGFIQIIGELEKGGFMNKSHMLKRAGVALVAVAGLTSTLAVMTAGSAAAATTSNQFTLCSTGNYTSQVRFNSRGDFSSLLVPKDECTTISTTGISSDSITVLGFYNNHPNVSFTVGSFTYDDSVGGGADAAGTTTAPQLLRW
jgi:hypothetical protein